jgi:hypothetical protein
MSGQRTVSSLALCAVMVTGCGVSAQAVANRANATRFYDSRLLAQRSVVSSDDPAESAPVVELRLATRIAMAPASLHSLVRVPTHPDNRRLRVLIDGEQYSRSSDTQLDGADAAKHYFFNWHGLPPGTYSIVAIVYGDRGVRGQRAGMLEVIGEAGGAAFGLR